MKYQSIHNASDRAAHDSDQAAWYAREAAEKRICLDRRAPPALTFWDHCDTFAKSVGYVTIIIGLLALIFTIVVKSTGAY